MSEQPNSASKGYPENTKLLSIQVAVETTRLNDPDYVKTIMASILETAQASFLEVMPRG